MSKTTPQFEPSYEGLYQLVSLLRGPNGCPWDRKQNPDTLKGFLLEETLECIDAITADDHDNIQEELGDVVLLTAMLIRNYEELELFGYQETIARLISKLIRRHPHVFGEEPAESAEEALDRWNSAKRSETTGDRVESTLSKIPLGISPLERGYQLQLAAAKVGFDWVNVDGVISKLYEEIGELKDKLNSTTRDDREGVEEEVGDILFCCINLCRILEFSPTHALHRSNGKFQQRFEFIESRLAEDGSSPNAEKFTRLQELWDEAKRSKLR